MQREPYHDEQEVRDAVARCRSASEALRRLGLRPAGGNFGTLRRLTARWGISTAHFDRNWARRQPKGRHRVPLEQVLVRGSLYKRASLKRRLCEEGLKERRCEMCGQGEIWQERRMSLILDHINGDAIDNRLENLQIVCPNCAATLDTHCGRKNRLEREPRVCLHCGDPFIPNRPGQMYCCQRCGIHSRGPRDPRPERRKVPRPSHEQLLTDLETMSFCAVGRKYGVSDNAVRKWLRWYERQAAADDEAEPDQRVA